MNQLFFWPVHINIFVCVDFVVHWEKETDDRLYVHFCYVYNYHIENSPPVHLLVYFAWGKQHIKHPEKAWKVDCSCFFNQTDAKPVHTGEMLQWLCLQVTMGCNIMLIWVHKWDNWCNLDSELLLTYSFLWFWLPHPCFYVWTGTALQNSDRVFQRIWDSPLWH